MFRSHAAAGVSPTRHLIVLTVSLFLSYLCVALSLLVVSVYVNQRLGLGDTLGGLAVGITFLATILARDLAGRLSDRHGGRHAMFRGLSLYALASLVCLVSSLASAMPLLAYAGLIVGRLLLGLGESLTIIGMVSWGMGLGGPARSGRVLPLMGMGMYGGLRRRRPNGAGALSHDLVRRADGPGESAAAAGGVAGQAGAGRYAGGGRAAVVLAADRAHLEARRGRRSAGRRLRRAGHLHLALLSRRGLAFGD